MKRIISGHHVVKWVAQQTNEYGDFGCAVGLGLQQWDGKAWPIIAGVAYADYNGVNIVAHIASDGSKRWLTREFLFAMFDYPFRQAKVERVTCLIGEGNAESRNLCERLGFTVEATLEKAHPTGDLLIYRLRKPQCKWLNLQRVHHAERLAA